MTDPTNPGGWPDATKPGVPLNPERDGVHWLRYQDGAYVEVTAFAWERDGWWHNGGHTHAREWRQWDYIAPVLTPAEIAAQVAAARAEEREACAALADENNGCLSPRCDCMDACAVDDVGKGIAAAIRARGTP